MVEELILCSILPGEISSPDRLGQARCLPASPAPACQLGTETLGKPVRTWLHGSTGSGSDAKCSVPRISPGTPPTAPSLLARAGGMQAAVTSLPWHNSPAICFMKVMQTPSAPSTPLFTSSRSNHTSWAEGEMSAAFATASPATPLPDAEAASAGKRRHLSLPKASP